MVAEAALEYVTRISVHGLSAAMIFEHIPFHKVLTVTNDATAHIRGPRINCVAVAKWEEGGKERLTEFRPAINQLVNMVLSGEEILPASTNTGYGNYGKSQIVLDTLLILNALQSAMKLLLAPVGMVRGSRLICSSETTIRGCGNLRSSMILR